MSWANELYRVYEAQCGREFEDGIVLMPVFHSMTTAKIEVTITEKGDFVNARFLSKDEGENTIFPVTDTSAGRSSKKFQPHPLADQIKYLAGDYSPDGSGDKPFYNSCFKKYISQLETLREVHPAFAAVYAYLSKECLCEDILSSCANGRVNIQKMEKQFVRFRINYTDFQRESRTWKDNELYNCFISWINGQAVQKQLCYATGQYLPITTNHAKNILKTSANAKLISANDSDGFNFKGRFINSNEAVSISSDFSYKMHNALKWLIKKQDMYFGSMALVVWASDLQELPDIRCEAFPIDDKHDAKDILGMLMKDFSTLPDTKSIYQKMLKKMIFGYKEKMKADTGVMILGVDAATKGRMSVVLYDELAGSDFLRNIENWHRDTACLRCYKKHNANVYNSFSVYDICNCAFGTEVAKELECKDDVLKSTVLRLIPCITEGKPLPVDIVRALYRKASAPLAYNKEYNHRKVVETACGMIRKYNIDRKDGITAMAYDPNETDRSYLYGCLLAVADAAERSTYESEDGRVTNARRYWSAFSGRPYQTWQIIAERLIPYLNKMGKGSVRYEKMFDEIMSKLTMDSFADNSALSPAYLLGYHHYKAEIYTSKTKEEEQTDA